MWRIFSNTDTDRFAFDECIGRFSEEQYADALKAQAKFRRAGIPCRLIWN
jgi:hypothetical protein